MANELISFGELFAEPTRNGLTRPKAIRGAGTKMVNMGELFAFPRISNAQMDRVPLTASEAKRALLEAGDLLFARQSLVLEGAGKCSIFLNDDEPVTFESHITRVRLDSKKANPLFYFYYFQSHHGRAAVRSIVEQGAGASGIRGSDLAGLKVFARKLDEQVPVARVLDSLDQRIELNRTMNEKLEAMARALFKSWFVDFEPVRAKAEGRPTGLPDSIAALFPDSFEESELGDKPTGWKTGKFDDAAKCVRSTIPADQIPSDTPYIALEHMPKRSIALSEWGKADGVASAKATFSTKNILFGKLRPYFHKVGLAPIDGVCSTDIVVLAPKTSDWLGFAVQHASSDAFVEYTYAGSTGTKMPRTSWPEMARYPMVIPPFEIAREFNRAVAPFYDRIIATIHQNISLSEIRDVLLPKLISGEIRLNLTEERA